ncbi:MAG: GyrI-like domain-containing protein [Candidatus Hodarchaeota archaeon]
MTGKNAIEEPKIEIIEDKTLLRLVGCVFYGDPFHSAEGWSVETEIGMVWNRFLNLYKKNKKLILKHQVNPDISYEVHIEPEEYKETKKFYIFVGVEVKELENIPLEMYLKILPATMYAKFTFQGNNIFKGGNYIYQEWLPQSIYQEAYPFLIQAYDQTHFKGLDNKKSELDYYVPIAHKDVPHQQSDI